MNDEELIRANVRAELARAGTNAAAMDRRLNWGRSTITRRLIGVAEWRVSELRAIADELGIPLARLYGGVSEPPIEVPEQQRPTASTADAG